MCLGSNSSIEKDDLSAAWYAIHTHHQHEKTVARILMIKGFDVFLPLYSANRRWKDRKKVLSLPLFPCYVFLKEGLDHRMAILATPGILALVSIAGRPAAISSAEIQAIRQALESGARVEPHPFLNCSDLVRVTSGPLEGIRGILIQKKNKYRLILSVQILGQAAAVEVDSDSVQRVYREPLANFHQAALLRA